MSSEFHKTTMAIFVSLVSGAGFSQENDRSSLCYNFGASWIDDSSEAAYLYTLTDGDGITDRFGLYAGTLWGCPNKKIAL